VPLAITRRDRPEPRSQRLERPRPVLLRAEQQPDQVLGHDRTAPSTRAAASCDASSSTKAATDCAASAGPDVPRNAAIDCARSTAAAASADAGPSTNAARDRAASARLDVPLNAAASTHSGIPTDAAFGCVAAAGAGAAFERVAAAGAGRSGAAPVHGLTVRPRNATKRRRLRWPSPARGGRPVGVRVVTYGVASVIFDLLQETVQMRVERVTPGEHRVATRYLE
jgi:hypothetical protein